MITILNNKKKETVIDNKPTQIGFTTQVSEPVYPLKDITKLVNVPKLILTQKLMSQIFTYHSLVGGKEWSGPLIYSREGCDSVEELYKDGANKTMELKGIEFLLADIGTAGGTEYELEDPEILNDLMDYQLNGYHAALIHTH